jgi:hypothetical protein
MAKDVEVNQHILTKYRRQHLKATKTTHWHTGNQTNEQLRNNIPSNLKITTLINEKVSTIIFKLLRYELNQNSYPLAAGITKYEYVDSCIKLFPVKNLDSNYLICKSYAVNYPLNKKFSMSIFFPCTGYMCHLKGSSKIITYPEHLSNTSAPEMVYSLHVKECILVGYDFTDKKVGIYIKP